MRLDDELLREAKRYASENDMTLTALMDEALREKLARGVRPTKTAAPELPTYRGHGLQQGVDLGDSAALLDLMESVDDSS